MTTSNIYRKGMEMLSKGNIHGALRELMIDFQLDSYKPEQTEQADEQDTAEQGGIRVEQGAE